MPSIENALTLVENALEALADPPTVYAGRQWPDHYDAPYAALLRFGTVEGVDGHGGVERRAYTVNVTLRYRQRDSFGEDRQVAIATRAQLARDAFHLVDPSEFATKPTGLWQVEVMSPMGVNDSPEEPQSDFIDTSFDVVMHTFETV